MDPVEAFFAHTPNICAPIAAFMVVQTFVHMMSLKGDCVRWFPAVFFIGLLVIGTLMKMVGA